jgi:IS30 family transposase
MSAAQEAGVSRTTGHSWSRGYKIYRNRQVSGFVPPLECLAVREISARFLSQEERIAIADLRYAGLSIRQIAPGWAGHHPRSPATCAATPPAVAVANRSRPTADDRAPGSPSPAAHRGQRRAATADRWAAGAAVEPAAGQSAPAAEVPRRGGDAAVSREYYQPGSPLLRPSALAPHRRSPLRTERYHRRTQSTVPAAAAQIRAADAHHQPATLPARGPVPGRP